jgi:von Willebrand factor type A domain
MRRADWAKRACALGFLLLMAACSASPKKPGVGPSLGFDNPVDAVSAGKGGSDGTAGKRSADRCIEGQLGASRVAPRVILVLDGSCSMSTDYPANGAASASSCKQNPKGRWAALRAALVDPQQGVVPKLQHVVQFGLVVFGTQNVCPIPGQPVRPALDNLNAIVAGTPNVQPGMYTPTGAALDWVYDNLIADATPDGDNGPQIVILATDGEPNSCGAERGGQVVTNYQPSIDAIQKGTQKGVTTYVISLADAAGDFHDHLQQLANLGNPGANGSATLYTPGSPDELASALESLVGGAVGCDIALDGVVTQGSECTGTVTLDGAALGCNDANGWKLLDGRHIRLQGSACKRLMDMSGQVAARFPCSSLSPE